MLTTTIPISDVAFLSSAMMSSRSGAFPAPNVSSTTPLRGGEAEKRKDRKKAAEIPGKIRRMAAREVERTGGGGTDANQFESSWLLDENEDFEDSPTSVHMPSSP